MKLKNLSDPSLFGTSAVILLTVLFGLTGLQMVVVQFSEFQGSILGDHGDQETLSTTPTATETSTPTPTTSAGPAGPLGPAGTATATPTATVTQSPSEQMQFQETETATVTQTVTVTDTATATQTVTTEATPTIIITPEPTKEQTNSSSTTNQSSSTEVTASNGSVVTTTNSVDRSTNETVRQIISKLGITTKQTQTAVAPAIKNAVTVVEQKTAGEILQELASIPGQTGQQTQVRLRYKLLNGQMALIGETETGQATPISASESARIIGTLERSDGLDITPSGPGENVFTKGRIRAETNLPLLVDLKTNLLTAETSTGIKSISLLPDEAIKVAFASKVVDGIYPKKSNAEITFSEAANGRLVYTVEGLSKRKLLALIPINLSETAVVDAANGQVSQPDKGLGKLLVELVAFPTN